MNRLQYATSPYLLQHAHNPVDWYEWGNEAWELAGAEDKLVLVSIGYSACHWCHVMEKESFENEFTAGLMNKHIICIKVDREERPDVDQVYMDACQLITQRGGWPLNVFCLPDGKPVHAGTYFPKAQWDEMVAKLANFYKTRKDEANEYAEKLTSGIRQLDGLNFTKEESEHGKEWLQEVVGKWKRSFDPTFGGYNYAPKFPMPSNYEFFLHYYACTGDESIRFQVLNTLRKMAFGGIYDQLGGGFARYSVDSYWKVPHFEKMLYDNAQLILLYIHAWQLSGDAFFLNISESTADFVYRELASEEGLFCSALDADSEGTEGKFYIWKKSEIESLLGEDSDLFCEYYQVDGDGLWEEDENILLCHETVAEFARSQNLDEKLVREKIYTCCRKLMSVRDRRIRPGLDDKCITSWNGMMITAYAELYRVTGKTEYIQRAVRAMEIILSSAGSGHLFRIHKNGKSSIPAFLEDYAFVIEALLSLYYSTRDEKWLSEAVSHVKTCFLDFYDPDSGFFYFTSGKTDELIVRKLDLVDDVIPSANSSLAISLYKLGHLFSDQNYIEIALGMLKKVSGKFGGFPTGYSNWMQLQLLKDYGLIQLVGNVKLLEGFAGVYTPHALFASAGDHSDVPLLLEKNDRSKIYTCLGQTCFSPVGSSGESVTLLREQGGLHLN